MATGSPPQGQNDPVARRAELMDADAVCVECGSVNPEGTLLCKTCGNNLRDQRLKRVAAEAQMTPAISPGAWLSKALAVLGILLVVLTLLNLDTIENWLTEAQIEQPDVVMAAEDFFPEPDYSVWSTLRRGLNRNPITPNEIDAARAYRFDPAVDGFPGRYVLMRPNREGVLTQVGEANVIEEDGKLVFLAQLYYGALIIRGRANIEETDEGALRAVIKRETPTAAMKSNDEIQSVFGGAIVQPDGSLKCFGRSENASRNYSLTAFHIPE